MDQAEAVDEYHSADEAIEAHRNLTPRDRVNLAGAARFFAGRGNIASPDELLNEAYIRVASGRRHWRKGTDFPRFFGGVIQSLASDDMFLTDSRKVKRLDGGYSVVDPDDLAMVRDESDGSAVSLKLMVEQMWSHMEMNFADDDEMQLLVMGIQDGLRGQELEAAVGVDTKRLATLRTRFKRELDKYIAARSAEERTVA